MALRISSRGSLALLVLLVAAALVLVLGRAGPLGGNRSEVYQGALAEKGSYDGPDSYLKGGAIDLIEYFPLAEVHTTLDEIRFQDPAKGRYLPMGWQRYPTATENTAGAWINSRNGVVEVPLFERVPLEVELTLRTHPESDDLSAQHLSVNWNGEFIKNLALDWGEHVYRVALPEDGQVLGINVLELMPEYRFLPEPVNNERAREAQAVQCRKIRFIYENAPPSSPATPAAVVDDAIHQWPGSLISYYFPVDKRTRFRATGVLRRDADNLGKTLRGRVRVVARNRSGEEKRLYDRALSDIRPNRPFKIDETLPVGGDDFIGITLSFWAEGASADLRLEWQEATLTAPRRNAEARAQFRPEIPRNVFIILYDSLRADHTEPYGGTVSTPEMTRMAAEGVTYLNAFSNSNWTRPSIASLLTSMHVTGHGIVTGPNLLPVNVPYLPSILQENGYRTLAISNNVHMSADFGFDRGFDEIHKYYTRREEVQRTYQTPEDQARHVWDEYIDPFLDQTGDSPFFIYLHEIDPHYPYRAPSPYDRMYGDPARSNLRIKLPLTYMLVDRSLVLEPEDAQYLDANYKGEITFMDAYLGWMLDKIRATGHRDDTLVLFVSDHGDEFLDHGMLAHGHTLYDELLRIPMIFSMPGTLPRGRALKANAELVDVAPTILEHLGVDVPDSMRGKNLFAALSEPDDFQHDVPVFASMIRRDSVRFRDWKLISQRPPEDGEGQWRLTLFNTGEDPGEHVNRYPVEPIVAKALRQMLRWRLGHDLELELELPFAETTEYTPEQQEHLRALGYLN